MDGFNEDRISEALKCTSLTAADLVDAIRPRRSSARRYPRRSLTTTIDMSQTSLFTERTAPVKTSPLPSAKDIIYNLRRSNSVSSYRGPSITSQTCTPTSTLLGDITSQSNQNSLANLTSRTSATEKPRFQSSPRKSAFRPYSHCQPMQAPIASIEEEYSGGAATRLQPEQHKSCAQETQNTSNSDNSTSGIAEESQHNITGPSTGSNPDASPGRTRVIDVFTRSPLGSDERQEDLFEVLSQSSSFAKNGGVSQFGSGTNLSAQQGPAVGRPLERSESFFMGSSRFNKAMAKMGVRSSASFTSTNSLFTAAMLKAEKRRRIQQWIETLC